MKPAEWISTKERLPENDREVVVLLNYRADSKNGRIDMKDIAIMYRNNDVWYFRDSKSEYRGKYIAYWLNMGDAI